MKTYWGRNTLVVFLITLATLSFLGSILFGAVALTRSTIKYNCQLDTHPGWNLALRINTSPYAYGPEKFCADVRNRMDGDK